MMADVEELILFSKNFRVCFDSLIFVVVPQCFLIEVLSNQVGFIQFIALENLCNC